MNEYIAVDDIKLKDGPCSTPGDKLQLNAMTSDKVSSTKLQTCNCDLFSCQKDVVTLTHLRVKDSHNASPVFFFYGGLSNGTLYAYPYTCQA